MVLGEEGGAWGQGWSAGGEEARGREGVVIRRTRAGAAGAEGEKGTAHPGQGAEKPRALSLPCAWLPV